MGVGWSVGRFGRIGATVSMRAAGERTDGQKKQHTHKMRLRRCSNANICVYVSVYIVCAGAYLHKQNERARNCADKLPLIGGVRALDVGAQSKKGETKKRGKLKKKPRTHTHANVAKRNNALDRVPTKRTALVASCRRSLALFVPGKEQTHTRTHTHTRIDTPEMRRSC